MLSTLPGHIHLKTLPEPSHRGFSSHRAVARRSFSPSTQASQEAMRASHRLTMISLEAAFAVRSPSQLRMSEYSAQVRQLVQIRHRRALRARGTTGGRVALTSLHIRREDHHPGTSDGSRGTVLEICGSAQAVGRRWAFAARLEKESESRPWRMAVLKLF
ncbi:hypothetical protein [Corynebacterium sp. CCM 9203]|uniref:hypothetical protein n=1 Tax=Corynebacterium sp. CCM 9203 TaxID=3057615 RepID=UPI0035259793